MGLAFYLEEILRYLDHRLNYHRHHCFQSLHPMDCDVTEDHSQLHAAGAGHFGLC